MATTTGMPTALSLGMTIGTGRTTVRLLIFHNRICQGNDAEAGFTSTFHLSYASHNAAPMLNIDLA
jgi:hypothetical protein